MGIGDWLIEHSVEIVSLIISLIGLIFFGTYFVKINRSQKISLANSPNSPIIQVNGNNNHISNLQNKLNKETVISEPKTDGSFVTDKKELIKKIENFIDENKPVSVLAQMALRLAEELKMDEYIEGFSNEINGFKDKLNSNPKEGLKMQKAKEGDRHRSIVAELNLQFKNGKFDSLSIPLFISQSIYDIENWINQISTAGNESLFILNAPPPELMVKELNVDPNEKIPYVINKDALIKIVNGVRLKIIDFLKRAKVKAKF